MSEAAEPVVATVEQPEAAADLPSPFEPEAAADSANAWDWFAHITASDRRYLLGPRPTLPPCPWCRCRTGHSEACEALRDAWSMPMPFGKHRGKPVRRLPADYLEWLAGLKLGGDLSAEVYRVLNRPEPIEESGDAEHTEPEASQ